MTAEEPTEPSEATLIDRLRMLANHLERLVNTTAPPDSSTRYANIALLREAARDLEEWDQAFEVYWAANRRGTELYNAAHPGAERTLPDQAKMVNWLIDELSRLRDIVAKQQEALNAANQKLFEAGKFAGQQQLKIDKYQAMLERLQREIEIKHQIIEEALRKKASGQS